MFLSWLFIYISFNNICRIIAFLNCSNKENITLTYPKIYWINMNSNEKRRSFMINQLDSLHLKHQMVSAITPSSPLFNLKILQKPCKRNTDKDISVILSHLYTIYIAINDKSDINNQYAIIMEDDVRILYDINFDLLINSVSDKNFGFLQLVTSNPEAILNLFGNIQQSMWTPNLWNLTSKGGKHALYWSAQAYLINKKVLKSVIDTVIDHKDTIPKFRIINSFDQKTCKFTETYPCVLANCLFADTYIFALATTYVSSTPLFNGAKIGFESEIHQNQVWVHKDAFQLIHDITLHLSNSSKVYVSKYKDVINTILPSKPKFILNRVYCHLDNHHIMT